MISRKDREIRCQEEVVQRCIRKVDKEKKILSVLISQQKHERNRKRDMSIRKLQELNQNNKIKAAELLKECIC